MLIVYFFAAVWISSGKVALNMRVCRWPLTGMEMWFSNLSMSDWNPMSNILWRKIEKKMKKLEKLKCTGNKFFQRLRNKFK